MVKSLFGAVVLGAILFAIYGLAALLSLPLRYRYRREAAAPVTLSKLALGLFGYTVRPLAVLAFTRLLLSLTPHVALLQAAVTPRLRYVNAWMLIWAAALLFAVVEGLLVQFYALRRRASPFPPLLRNIIRVVLTVAVVLITLRFYLGINISSLLASTALLTAVVGFALQGVLGNLMAGMSMHLVRSVVPSDWVAVGNTEGEVIETNWRETRLRTLAGHIMVIPNSLVASTAIHNMTYPTPERRHQIEVTAGFAAPPSEVIQALLEAAKTVPAVLPSPSPSAYITEFRDYGVRYRLRFWSRTYHNRVPLEGDVQRMIWYQFDRRGIRIPFPVNEQVLAGFVAAGAAPRSTDADADVLARDLQRSDFVSKILVDNEGHPLLSDAELHQIAALVRRVRFTAGETLFRQGTAGDNCYVVVRGEVHGRVEHSDVVHATEFHLGPGSLFGEMSLLSGLPRTATVSAPGDVELIEISSGTLRRLLALRPDIPEHLAKLVAERSAQNAASLQKLKEMDATNVAATISRENILSRFLRMLTGL